MQRRQQWYYIHEVQKVVVKVPKTNASIFFVVDIAFMAFVAFARVVHDVAVRVTISFLKLIRV